MRRWTTLWFVTGLAAVGWGLLLSPGRRPVAPSAERGDPSARAANPPAEAHMPPAGRPAPTQAQVDPPQTNLLSQILKGGDFPKLRLDQIESFLDANHRSAVSLLTGYALTGDRTLLDEVKSKFPNDPRVAYVAWRTSADSPEQRRQWLDAFRASAPDNALAFYLSAADYFKSSQPDLAVQDMEQAAGNTQLEDYSRELVQSAEEGYRAAGYSDAEAKAIAVTSALLPQLADLKQLGGSLSQLASAYTQAGDTDSAQAATQMALDLGRRLTTGQSSLVQDLVGVAIERQVLSTMDPNASSGIANETVAQRLDELVQQRQSIQSIVRQFDGLMGSLPDTEVANFFERQKSLGEWPALMWLVDKYGHQ